MLLNIIDIENLGNQFNNYFTKNPNETTLCMRLPVGKYFGFSRDNYRKELKMLNEYGSFAVECSYTKT